MQKAFSDQTILNALLKGGLAEDTALRQVYLQNRTPIFDFVKKNSGTTEEAKDVFQEAVMAFYENVKNGRFKGESTMPSYIYSIARFIWLNKLKRKNVGQRILETQQPNEATQNFLPHFLEKEQEKQVLGVFEKLGSDCKKVLLLNIYQQLNMQEIAVEMNYENEQIARNKKYKCLKKLKEMIAEKPAVLGFLTGRE